MEKLYLACGQVKREGFKGVDKIKTDATDIVMDLTVYPWDFADNSIDEILCEHYVEHIQDIIRFMDEAYRILKNGAMMTIIAPYYSSIRAWQDPTHVRAISEALFPYFNKNWRKINRLEHYDIKSNFDTVNVGYFFVSEWENKNENEKTFAAMHYLNVINDIRITLIKR